MITSPSLPSLLTIGNVLLKKADTGGRRFYHGFRSDLISVSLCGGVCKQGESQAFGGTR